MKQNYDDMMIFQDMISHDLRTITYAKMLTAYCTRPETKKLKKLNSIIEISAVNIGSPVQIISA